MRTCLANVRLGSITLTLLAASGSMMGAKGQGTLTFDSHNNWVGTHYTELGMALDLVVLQGSSYDYMGITLGGGNTPRDGTPFMGWFRQYNQYNYVSLSLTNGSLFGLTSAQLADPQNPSTLPVAISFVGYLGSGGTVTNTFSAGGGGTSVFGNCTFGSSFASGLSRVDILAPRWAMDNLVFTIPEPSGMALVGLGLLALLLRRRGGRT